MNESRFDCRCTCAACADGHMGCVQEPLFDSALLDGQGSPKFQYSAREAAAAQNCTKLCEIILWETDAQSAEKKPACDNHDFRETNPVLLALFIPEVGMFKRKISCRIHAAPASRALLGIRCAMCGLRYRLALSGTPSAARDETSQHAQLHRCVLPPQQSSRTLPPDPAGQPAITKNTSRTKSPMAMSLKSDAWGRPGQNWFAAQKRKAATNRLVLNNSAGGPKPRCRVN
jgi:hypothetical protein